MALPKLEGRQYYAGARTCDVTELTPTTVAPGVNIVSAAGNYYWTSATAILSAFQTALNAVSANSTYTVTLDDTGDAATGKVTITATGITSFSLTWNNSDIRDALGFTGNLGGALTYTGSNQAKFLWLPNVGRTNPMWPEGDAAADDFGKPESDYVTTWAPSGASYRTAWNLRRVDNFEFAYCKANKVALLHEATTNESFEKFYRDVVSGASGVVPPFRYHPDRSSDTVYWELVFGPNAGACPIAPHHPGWTGVNSLWRVGPIEVRKLV